MSWGQWIDSELPVISRSLENSRPSDKSMYWSMRLRASGLQMYGQQRYSTLDVSLPNDCIDPNRMRYGQLGFYWPQKVRHSFVIALRGGYEPA